MKNNNYIKYILITFAIVFSIFFKVDNVFAESCSNDNTMICRYKVVEDKMEFDLEYQLILADGTVTLHDEKLTQITNESGANIELSKLDSLNRFKNSSGSYVCPESLSYKIGTGPAYRHYIYIAQTLGENKDFENKALKSYECSSFPESYKSAVKSCGIYGENDTGVFGTGIFGSFKGIELFVTKKADGKFEYSGNYIAGKNVEQNDYSSKGQMKELNFNPQNVRSDGCPEKMCYDFLIDHLKTKASNTNCHGLVVQSLNSDTASDISSWDRVKAQLFGANDITDGTIECEDTLGDALGVLQKVFTAIKVCSVILTIILIMLDFIKTITSDDGDLKKVSKASVKRLVILVVIIILPSLINFIIETIAIGNGACSIR